MNYRLFEKKLETIIKTPKNMGTEEAILENIKAHLSDETAQSDFVAKSK